MPSSRQIGSCQALPLYLSKLEVVCFCKQCVIATCEWTPHTYFCLLRFHFRLAGKQPLPLCLPGFPFRFTGKHFLAFPLAWTLLFPIRQAFPRFSVCLDSVFSFQAVGCTLNRLSRLQNSNLGSSIFQEFTVPFLKIQSRQFIMTEIHCLNGNNQKQPVANHCLFAQIQMRTVNSLIISLSECQIRKRDSYKGYFTSHEGSVPSGEVFSDKIRVAE